MTGPIDWNKPIIATPTGVSLFGVAGSQTPADRFLGIREEQIRRACILIEAAGGKALTKSTVRRTVGRLAKQVPGLRYKFGISIFSSLAPTSTLFGDDLPGKDAGRPAEWSVARRRWLADEVAMIRASDAGLSNTDALRVLIKRLAADRKYPPTLKTLQNQLSKAPKARPKP